MEKLEDIHNIFTDDSNSFVKYEDLVNYLKDKTPDEQNEILVKLIKMSDRQDIAWIKKSKEFENLFSKREVVGAKKRVTAIKKATPSQKEFIRDEMKSYKNKINELAKLGFEEFSQKVSNESYSSRDMDFIILGLEKDIKDYIDISSEDYKTKNISAIKDTENEINAVKAKQNCLLDLKEKLTEVVSSDSNKCRIIFLQKSSGRTYFIEDVKGEIEHYKSFFNLLQSLIKGKPELCKMFYGSTLSGICETRDLDRQTRILFDKIDDDTYVVIKGFIKKEDTSSLYRSVLSDMGDYYYSHKDEIIEKLNDEDYLQEQEEILNNVVKMLSKQ